MKIKHSKYRNTGILFELLTRQITADTLSGNSNKSLDFLKKHFNSKSELLKEYKIYHTLSTKKYKEESKANILLNTLLESYKDLNKSKLRREKYNLIKEIKENYDITNFFNSKISNYKIMASIFNLLENKKISFQSNINSKLTLLEHITQKNIKKQKNVIIETLKGSDQNTRLLTYKVILEKFNNKYKSLADNQKLLLQEYVNSVSNSPALKLYINEEIKKVKKNLNKYSKKIKDQVVVIKLNETKDLIQPFNKKTSIQDSDVTNLLNYYELINELKTIHG